MQEKTRVATLSVISNSFLTISKAMIGITSGSVSILSEGIHSGIDLIAAVIALFAVRESGKPADDQHEYGHGKIENVSGTVEAILIFVAAIWIIVEAFKKLLDHTAVESLGFGILIMAVSAGLNLVISTTLIRIGKKVDSIALVADGMHLRTDVYTSAGVFIGLFLIKLTGWTMLDPIIAIFVALLIIKTSFKLTKEAFMPLVDVSLPINEREIIISVINNHDNDFIEFHKLRTRRSGAERHIDLHLVVPQHTSVAEVHALCDQIEREINEQLAEAHVLIHAEPCTDRKSYCENNSPQNCCTVCPKKEGTKLELKQES